MLSWVLAISSRKVIALIGATLAIVLILFIVAPVVSNWSAPARQAAAELDAALAEASRLREELATAHGNEVELAAARDRIAELEKIGAESASETDRLKDRISDLSRQNSYLAARYAERFNSLNRCASLTYLNHHLGVAPVLTDEARISRETIAQYADGDIVAVWVAPNSLAAISQMSLTADEAGVSVKLDKELTGPTAVDFLIETSECALSVRLLFFPVGIGEPDGYEVTQAIGRSGLELGSFSLPYGSDFHHGELWVSDCSNEIVQIFARDGFFRDSFSGFGTRFGQMDTPADIKVVGDEVFVIEERNHRLQVFGLDGVPVDILGAYGDATEDPQLKPGKFNNPLGVADGPGQIAIVDSANNRLQSFTRDGRLLWISGNGEGDPFTWQRPYYIENDPVGRRFVISNRGANELAFVSYEGEKLGVAKLDSPLDYPHEVAVGPQGRIFVADTYNHRVLIYSGNDAPTQSLPFPESWGLPKTVAVDNDGRLAVGFVGAGSAYLLMLEPAVGIPPPVEEDEPAPIDIVAEPKPELETRSIASLYSHHCAACHEEGRYDAPHRGSAEDWEPMPRDLDVLLGMVRTGNGAMIVNGGCEDCSDDELLALIRFIVPKTWEFESQ